MQDVYLNWIDGAWAEGGAGRMAVENPGTTDTVAEQAVADAADIDKAVQAASRVHQSGALWNLRPVERGRMVRAIGDHLLANQEDLAKLLCLEQGKTLWEARNEVRNSARYFEYYGNQAETMEGRQIPLGDGYFDFTVLEPYGVTGHITPWNFPLEVIARSLAAGLATGNTCVVKSSEITPLSAHIYGPAAEAAGFPAGAVNVLAGYGADAGAALSSHPDVRQIVFTGSVPTGIAIAGAAAKNVVPCILELGGKSAAIVYPDADLDAFEGEVRKAIFTNAGQICSAMSRIVVHRSIHDELVERVSTLAQSIDVGPGIDRDVVLSGMGSMASGKQLDRAVGLVTRGEADGAQLVTGGRRLNLPGHFLPPTVLDNVDPASELGQTEVFAPVVSVMDFERDEDAVAIANGTDYGLVGGVFTRDLDRATRTARSLRGGQIYVNEWFAGGVETPFGGYGKSGYGREKGREALWNYVQTKNVAIKLG
jgi:aldehyde dehydrogenase (NAD+)